MRQSSVALFFAFVMLVGARAIAKSQGPGSVLNRGVQVEVRVVKPVAKADSRGVFEVSLRNVSRDAAIVYGKLTCGIVLEIRDPSGNKVIAPVFYDELKMPWDQTPSDWVHLQSGHALSFVDDRSLRELGVATTGAYSVRATYWHVVVKDENGLHLTLASKPMWSATEPFEVVE